MCHKWNPSLSKSQKDDTRLEVYTGINNYNVILLQWIMHLINSFELVVRELPYLVDGYSDAEKK